MAERSFGETRRDSLQKKLYAYRKTQQKIREHYPDAPLLIASWDLANQWVDEEVRVLLSELDPERTLLLDYTADDVAKCSFRDWNVLWRFPWIFGMLHGYAWNSDIHGDYTLLAERLRTAAEELMRNTKSRRAIVRLNLNTTETAATEHGNLKANGNKE